MKELHLKAIKAYLEMLTIHIDSKTMDDTLHAETEGYYEKLFDVAHQIGERHVDLGGSFEETSVEQKEEQVMDIITNLKNDIESYVENNKTSLWTTKLLSDLANGLEDIEGSSKIFSK